MVIMSPAWWPGKDGRDTEQFILVEYCLAGLKYLGFLDLFAMKD